MTKNRAIKLRRRSGLKNVSKTNCMSCCITIRLVRWSEIQIWLILIPSLILTLFRWVKSRFYCQLLQHLKVPLRIKSLQVDTTCRLLSLMLYLISSREYKAADSKSSLSHINHWIWFHLLTKIKNRVQNILSKSAKWIRRQKLHMELEVLTSPEVELMEVMEHWDKDKLYQFINCQLIMCASGADNRDITLRIAQLILMKLLIHIMERESQRSICGKEISVSVLRSS